MEDELTGDGSPYGGLLVDLRVTPDRAAELRRQARNFSGITLSGSALADLELLINGAYSPLPGFMTRVDYEAVLCGQRLANGLLWPLPVCLEVTEDEARTLSAGQTVALRDPEGFMPAVLHLEDLWPIPFEAEAEAIFGTADPAHTGVALSRQRAGTWYAGGTVEALQLPLHLAFKRYRHTPAELRALYHKLGWRRIVGYHTHRPVHRATFEMTLAAMSQARANLLLHPVVRRTRATDIDYITRVRCYLAAGKYYPPNMMLLSLLSFSPRLAGPRETLLHAIIRRNYGCTHFMVECPSDEPEARLNHETSPASLAAAQKHAAELGIGIIAARKPVYVPNEDRYLPPEAVPSEARIQTMTDHEFHHKLRHSRRVPEWYTFPEVVAELRQAWPPRHQQGFTIFCTGLSGAGKSTIARILYARLLEMATRPVTLLDGDIVRRNLSSELGFSKAHRDLNVLRIGFVASEITKNRGIAICAPIAPYTGVRHQIRNLIETYGGFVEVFVATPLEVCESRDRKGLYAKARAGQIKGFTGIDDPYEPPKHPEIIIDTTHLTPDEAAQDVLLFLEREGFIH